MALLFKIYGICKKKNVVVVVWKGTHSSQTETELGPRVYPFLPHAAVLPGKVMLLSRYRHPKPLELNLLAAAWPVSKSFNAVKHDRPKPKLPKRKDIYQFR